MHVRHVHIHIQTQMEHANVSVWYNTDRQTDRQTCTVGTTGHPESDRCESSPQDIDRQDMDRHSHVACWSRHWQARHGQALACHTKVMTA
jgi:hypothetical protein